MRKIREEPRPPKNNFQNHKLYCCLVCGVTAIIFFGLSLIVLVRAALMTTTPVDVAEYQDAESFGVNVSFPPLDEARLNRWRESISIPTVSFEPGRLNESALLAFRAFLEKSFPLIHGSSIVKRQIFANFSILYEVEGKDSTLLPYLLCAHQDVVPVDTDSKWNFDPWNGPIEDGYLYGRGTMDDKSQLMAIMEVLEHKLSTGDVPNRTFYLAFGHDEEVYGSGAAAIAAEFARRNLTFEFVLDEGGVIARNIVPSIPADTRMAMVSVAEKGWLTLKLKAQGKSGHASMPHRNSAIAKIANAVTRLENNPYPNAFGRGIERRFYELLAPHLPFWQRILFANLWLFQPIVVNGLERVASPGIDSLMRTTTATTVISGGVKWNVLPAKAEAIVQHRVHPAQTIDEVVLRDKTLIDDPDIELERLLPEAEKEATVSAPFEGQDAFGWHVIKNAIHRCYEKTLVLPQLLPANTDTRYYGNFSKAIYRFQPILVDGDELVRIHGVDERLKITNYQQMMEFYARLLQNSDFKTLTPFY